MAKYELKDKFIGYVDTAQHRIDAVANLITAYQTKIRADQTLTADETKKELSAIKQALTVPFRQTDILWIDRNPANNGLEREALSDFGLCFTLVRSTDEGLEAIRRSPNRYSMILTNFADPPSDGKSRLPILDKLQGMGLSYPIAIYSLTFTPQEAKEARENGTPQVRSPLDLYSETFQALRFNKEPVGNIELIKQSIFKCYNDTSKSN
jgi:hypothetical protein